MKNKETQATIQHYRILFEFLKPKAGLIALTALAIIVFSVLIGGLPFLTQKVTKAVASKDLDALKDLCLLGVVFFLVRGVSHFLKDILASKLSLELLHSMRTKLFNHLLTLDLDFFSKSKKGDLNLKISSELSNISGAIFSLLQDFIPAIIMVVVLGAYLVYTNLYLTLFILILIPAMAVITYFFGYYISLRTRKAQESSSSLSSYLIDFFGGIRLIKTFSTEPFEAKRFYAFSKKQKIRAFNLAFVENLNTPVISFVQMILALGFFYFAFYNIHHNIVTIDEFFGYLMGVGMFIDPLRVLLGKYSDIKKLNIFLDRTFSMFTTQAKIRSYTERKDFKLKELNKIEFKNIKFSYEKNNPVIKNLSFAIEDKSLVGIVGLSGAGKSTLISLLLRFYDPEEGGIFLGGKNIKDFNISNLRRLFGVVLQDSFLFTGSIKDNIAYGYSEPKDEDLIEVSKQAGIYDFIEALPDKFDTALDEGAVNLSGGQKQRLAIARALFRKPRVLVFDEATSNIDAKSEALIKRTIHSLKGKITVIVIAHRFATIKDADKVVVLENGRVKEEGNHEALMAEEGLYSDLYMEYSSMKKVMP